MLTLVESEEHQREVLEVGVLGHLQTEAASARQVTSGED